MEKRVFELKNKRIEKLNYLLNIPQDYKENKYPLIITLHGAGERGDDFDKISVHGIAKYIKAGRNIPAVVIAPQCPEEYIWNQITVELKELIDHIITEYNVDDQRVSITGLSMGGYGTWEMGMAYPGFFSAIAPICGGGVSWRTYLIGKTPVWAFHGDEDKIVPVNNSYEMCDKLKSYGGNVKLTIFHGVEHNSWEAAYEDTKLIEWLLESKKSY